jgi:hypothetical protein
VLSELYRWKIALAVIQNGFRGRENRGKEFREM